MNEHSGHAVATRDGGELQATESTRPGPVFTPAVDIFENAEAITVLADLPGVTPDTLSIDLDDGKLTIVGHCDTLAGEGEADVFREYEGGTYSRTFTLSEVVNQAGINASIADGVLRLELPKVERAKPLKIEVKSAT